MLKVGTGPCFTTPALVSRSAIGWNVAMAIGEENGVYFVLILRLRWMYSPAGALDGNAKSKRPRSIEVAIWREPAGSISTFTPLSAKARTTCGSSKNAFFSEPITPRTTASGGDGG